MTQIKIIYPNGSITVYNFLFLGIVSMNVNDIYVFNISWPSLTQTLQLCHAMPEHMPGTHSSYSSPPFRAWFCSMAMYLACQTELDFQGPRGPRSPRFGVVKS